MENLTELFEIGGWALYGILLCSIMALAIFLERLWMLRRSQVLPENILTILKENWSSNNQEKLQELFQNANNSLSNILRLIWAYQQSSVTEIRTLIQDAVDRESLKLERGVDWLATLAALAPMLGFLGTVLGMVDMFSNIAAEGEIQDIGVIAGGIYKALYTTIAGLTVAIPVTLFHRTISSKVNRLSEGLEEASEIALAWQKEQK